MEEKKKMNRKRKLFPIRLFVCNDQHTLRAYMAAIFVLCVVREKCTVGFFIHEYISFGFASMKRRKTGKVLHYPSILIFSHNFIFL